VVGAAHAGWKGALAGVTDAVIAEMERIGANGSESPPRRPVHRAMPSYEVDELFKGRFLEADPAGQPTAASPTTAGRSASSGLPGAISWMADLIGIAGDPVDG
jgi:polyphenol oxidase